MHMEVGWRTCENEGMLRERMNAPNICMHANHTRTDRQPETDRGKQIRKKNPNKHQIHPYTAPVANLRLLSSDSFAWWACK